MKAKMKKKELTESEQAVETQEEAQPEQADIVPLVAEPVAWAEPESKPTKTVKPNLETKKVLEKDFEEIEVTKRRKHKWKPPTTKKTLSVKDKLAALLGGT